jgi:hypothetical protein
MFLLTSFKAEIGFSNKRRLSLVWQWKKSDLTTLPESPVWRYPNPWPNLLKLLGSYLGA